MCPGARTEWVKFWSTHSISSSKFYFTFVCWILWICLYQLVDMTVEAISPLKERLIQVWKTCKETWFWTCWWMITVFHFAAQTMTLAWQPLDNRSQWKADQTDWLQVAQKYNIYMREKKFHLSFFSPYSVFSDCCLCKPQMWYFLLQR